MKVLAFDTSTEILSLCLMKDGDISMCESLKGLRHGQTLLPALSQLLDNSGLVPADLDLIVCARGPGSFTGLRIGMTTAKGLSEGTGAPVVSVDTLDILARNFPFFDGAVVPVIDARKSRFYTSVYTRGNRVTEQLDCTVDDLIQLTERYQRILITGPGAPQCTGLVSSVRGGVYNTPGQLYGSGYALALLGTQLFHIQGPDSPEQGPVYIRKSDAELHRM